MRKNILSRPGAATRGCRARAIEKNLPVWGQSLYKTLNTGQARNALEGWKAAP